MQIYESCVITLPLSKAFVERPMGRTQVFAGVVISSKVLRSMSLPIVHLSLSAYLSPL